MAIDELLARAAGNLAAPDTIPTQPAVADTITVQALERLMRNQALSVAGGDLANTPRGEAREKRLNPGLSREEFNQRQLEQGSEEVTGDQAELLKMALASLMDPNIDANDVGSQLLQQITMDTLGPQQTTADSPGGLKSIFGNILKSLFAANAEAQKPTAGRR